LEEPLNKILAIAVASLICQGCASIPSRQASAVKEADARQVANCALISNIVGRSLVGGMGATGEANALVDAKEQASGLGATHIVVQGVDAGTAYKPATVSVRAYKCN
jgi:hypothetical protein